MGTRRRLLKQERKETKEALNQALQGLKDVRMTSPNDEKLAALKEDIRRTIEQTDTDTE